jgi:hypothetical protein
LPWFSQQQNRASNVLLAARTAFLLRSARHDQRAQTRPDLLPIVANHGLIGGKS